MHGTNHLRVEFYENRPSQNNLHLIQLSEPFVSSYIIF